MRLGLLSLLLGLAATGSVAQQAARNTTIRVQTSEVLVPTLVETHAGEVIYGLGPGDFSLTDNGVPQTVQVDEDLDSEPMSLVVAVEKGRMAALEMDKVNHLAPLLELFLGQNRGEAALVSFDSQPETTVDFTPKADAVRDALRRMEPGDGGAAILDAVSYSVHLLEQRPKSNRRVLLLVSETRDHGSRSARPEEIVKQIGLSNVLVLSVAFSPAKAEFLHDVRTDGREPPTMDMMGALVAAVQAVRKNVARQIAVMSGGEYGTFTTERGFEDRIQQVAKHARVRYLLSFRPTDNAPGLHVLSVKLTQPYAARVVARTSYWAAAEESAPDPGPPTH